MDLRNLQVGDKLSLFRRDKKDNAYKDQYGIMHPAFVVTKEVEITITETREVKGVYNPEEKHMGYIASDGNGRTFFQHWESFDENSNSPWKYWLGEKNEEEGPELYENAVLEIASFFFQAERGPVTLPLIRENGDFVPSEYEYCKKHYSAFKKSEKCSKCK